MRLHRLTLQAFGPFAGREEVDFDALAGSGLFLLHGPTGAGKTSVLDAVCFALYGVVPGARARTGRLRSDHAPDGMPPEVVCEFSVGPRRIEVTRAPAWQRPKRRGDGTTIEQARVRVREWVDAAWIIRTSRLDEAGQLLEGLLGLGHEQFTKLVLLPQGDFAAFLRSDAETRRAILEKLFDTDRFSAVQQWLRQAHGQARQERDEARARTRELLARADQACAQLPDDTPDPLGPAVPPTEDDDEAPPAPDRRVSAQLAHALHTWEDATSRRAAAQAGLARARAAHAAGIDLARRQQEHARLAAAAARLAAEASAHAERRARLQRAERALGVAPVAPRLLDADSALEAAGHRLDLALREAVTDPDTLIDEGGLREALEIGGVLLLDSGVLAGLDDAVLADAVRALGERRGHLRGVLRDAAQLDPAAARVLQAQRLVEHERLALADAVAGAEALGPALFGEQQRLAEARALAAGLPQAKAALAAAEAAAAAVLERERLEAEVSAEQPRLRRLRDQRDAARQRWLDLREQRLRQMAAELAEGLSEGAPCPVCGATEHPTPAVSGPDRVTEEQEGLARVEHEQAEAEWAGCDRALQRLVEQLARVAGAAGGLDPGQAAAGLDGARVRLAAARSAAEGLAGREDTVQRLLAAGEHAAEAIEAARTRMVARQSELAASAAAVQQLRARVVAARGQDRSLEVRIERLEKGSSRLEAVLEARRRHADALRAAAAARRTALAAAKEAGFGDLGAAVAAVLDEPERLELERRVRAHDDELAAVTAQLADPAVVAAAQLPAPDVVHLAAAEVLAQGDDEACARRIALAEEAVTQLREIESALVAHLAVAEPLEQRDRLVAELARCADGTGGDNGRRMSLSAYVLAARLEQVAAVASDRLAQMSGGRYTLVHTDEVVRGQRRGGLGLHVIDAWTGRRRDTTSLSGGESFYTSLALALGLADVVSAEAGGTVIETLFVDEGFGSLDEDTLEEVMDVLDGLRSGGRAVGLVSHVADLRQRIPAQIEVVKGRDGSRLSVACSTAESA